MQGDWIWSGVGGNGAAQEIQGGVVCRRVCLRQMRGFDGQLDIHPVHG